MARPKVPVRRSQQLAWLITIPLYVLAVATTLPVVLTDPDPLRNVGYAPAFLVFFAASSFAVLRFDVRRQGVNVQLAELPLLLALYYLSPLLVLTMRVAAAVLFQAFRPQAGVKAAFNVGGLAAGAACANLFIFVFGGAGSAPGHWLVLAGAVYLNLLVTLVAVTSVIVLVQGPAPIRYVLRSAFFGVAAATVNITVALVMLLTLQVTRWAVFLLAALAIVLGVVYRAYAQFLRQHKSLTEMYELTKAIGGTVHNGTIADAVLARVRALMQAESATLWLPELGRHPELLLSARADYPGLLDTAQTPDRLRQQAIQVGQTVAIGRKVGSDAGRAELREHDVKDAIVVPLRSGNAVIGTLEVAGRLGDNLTFGQEDVRLLETIAAQASVAVENSRLVDRLRFDASHDALTGLANRRRLLSALDEAVRVRTPGEVVALLLFDVADLRRVNESLGHAAGDQVLLEVANRLRTLAPAAALVARVGGDEFVVELRTPSVDTAIAMAQEIRDGVRGRMDLGTLTIDVDTSVGVAVHPDHGDESETLLRRAEMATHAAKTRLAVQPFNPGFEMLSARRLGLAADLRKAIDAGEIEVYFQPKVALSDRRLVGVECLARWDHPVHGSVAPQDFVAVGAHIGELGRLTESVLRQGLGRAREWASSGRTLAVAVNVAPRTLLDPDFPDQVAGLLAEYGVQPQSLTLEVTEAALGADTERPLPGMTRLRELGVRLSVDDFGSGYSSLSYLGRLPLDELKIDRTFIQGMATDPRDLAVVRTAVDMGRHFGLAVVAEGVESELTLGLLEETGCDLGQGFLFSRPLPYERFDAWLLAQTETETEPVPAGEVRWLRAVP